MRRLIRLAVAGLFCIAIAAAVVIWLLDLAPASWKGLNSTSRRGLENSGARRAGTNDNPIPEAGRSPVTYDLVLEKFEDGGYDTAVRFMAPIKDLGSLQELREAIRGRGRRALAALRADYEQLSLDTKSGSEQILKKVELEQSIGFVHMYDGRFLEATSWLEKALETSRRGELSSDDSEPAQGRAGDRRHAAGRDRELPRVLGPSSCIFPIAREAVHQNPAGSREAIKWFTAYLEESPRDLRVLWLLNIAYMTLGEYPEKVPPQYLIPPEPFRSKVDVGRFENVALRGRPGRARPEPGRRQHLRRLQRRRPARPLHDLARRRPGRVPARSTAATALSRTGPPPPASVDQVYALNVTRADFDNDGDLDVLLLRGGWEKPLRLSLLRNNGGGVFEDVTVASGLAEPIATESAAWGDYDNDGFVDLFVCGEYLPPGGAPSKTPGDPRNRCRLYHNQGDGTFKDVAAAAGVTERTVRQGIGLGRLRRRRPARPLRLEHGPALPPLPQRRRRHVPRRRPRARRHRPRFQLRLLVLGLRQRRPARPLRQRLPGPGRRGARHRPGRDDSKDRAAPASTATSAPTASATSPRRSGSTGRWRRWARISATSTTTATSTSTSAPAACPTRAWSPT